MSAAIELREEIYKALKKEMGEEGVSEKINEILYNALFKEKKSLFGTMEKTDVSDLRDHRDRI
jgi:predicted CopG family antitoxin